MNIKPKFVAKYNVWLELQDELICVFDQDKNNSFVLGTLTKEGIDRNRDVTKEQFEAIALLYSTANRYFCSRSKKGQKKKINNVIKPKYVKKINIWLELREKDIYICPINKDNDFILGTLTEKGIVRNRNVGEDQSRIIGSLYVIAERHFSPSTKENIDRTTARFIHISRHFYWYLNWEAWFELRNQEVYLYPLAGKQGKKIAEFVDIPEICQEKEFDSDLYNDLFPEIYEEIYQKAAEIAVKQISFCPKNIFDFTEENNLQLFRGEISDICQTTARRLFCPRYRQEQKEWKKFRHKQKYGLIQDALNKINEK